MPNPITGDFEAVLQVSGSTIDRLLASMHQQFGTPTSLPVFPHDSFILLGDDAGASGVRGIARIQLSPPRIELLHAAHDRFVIRVWVRAHFTPDSGSAAFPTFIYGEVRAEYRIREEHHPRYGVVIASYVDPSGVTFTSAGPDKSWLRDRRDFSSRRRPTSATKSVKRRGLVMKASQPTSRMRASSPGMA